MILPSISHLSGSQPVLGRVQALLPGVDAEVVGQGRDGPGHHGRVVDEADGHQHVWDGVHRTHHVDQPHRSQDGGPGELGGSEPGTWVTK